MGVRTQHYASWFRPWLVSDPGFVTSPRLIDRDQSTRWRRPVIRPRPRTLVGTVHTPTRRYRVRLLEQRLCEMCGQLGSFPEALMMSSQLEAWDFHCFKTVAKSNGVGRLSWLTFSLIRPNQARTTKVPLPDQNDRFVYLSLWKGLHMSIQDRANWPIASV